MLKGKRMAELYPDFDEWPETEYDTAWEFVHDAIDHDTIEMKLYPDDALRIWKAGITLWKQKKEMKK